MHPMQPTQPQSPPQEGQQQKQSQRQMWSPYDEGPRTRGPFWFIIGGVGVLGLLATVLVIMFNADAPTPAASETRPSSAPLPTAPGGTFAFAEARETDPKALTVKELFPAKKITHEGRTYSMTTSRKDTKCAEAVEGKKLEKALKSGKCNMIIRASFRDAKGKVIGTVGVANLLNTKASEKVVAATSGKGAREDYIKPLPGKDEVTKFLGSGEAGAKVWVHGHYAVLVWFQFKDGSKPDKKGTAQLFQAATDITNATVFKAMQSRSLTGYPG
ncbi:hypothetical protein ACIBG7_04570 [Nonomuraea sp. NPDC050328]|uniref:hypothetical protein n=1 Tax=Nonomuraea sp. NPDC050328 TaxID=3364361 RepID=UPI0037881999